MLSFHLRVHCVYFITYILLPCFSFSSYSCSMIPHVRKSFITVGVNKEIWCLFICHLSAYAAFKFQQSSICEHC